MINYTSREIKGYYSNNNPRKKVHRIADITFVVIDESLVKLLSIDDETWFEQEAIEEGILLRISDKSKGIDVN
jgi:hypothetical protein